MTTFPCNIKAGDTITLHGDVTIPKTVVLPAGKPITVQGNAHIRFAGNGKTVGNGGMFCFQVNAGVTLNINPGLCFDFPDTCGLVNVIDQRKKPDWTTGGRCYLNGAWLLRGNLFDLKGVCEAKAIGCWSDGTPNKYYAICSTLPNGLVLLDNRGVSKTILGGKNEAAIRSMQAHRFEMYGMTVRGTEKQRVQIRSGDTALISQCIIDSLAEGWLEDPTISNVQPLSRVDINQSTIGAIDWGSGDNGQVFRDGKRIK